VARAAGVPALLFAGAALLSGITMLDGLQPNDEGLMLQAAARIADGQVPYSDFWWFYPPGQPYLLGGLWELFGPSLLPWRVLRVLCDATVAVLAWALARRGGASPGLALAAWLAAALAMAYPTGPHPFPPTLAMALGALLLLERRPALAGALAGLAAVWRIEFAAYLWLGAMLAYAMRPAQAAATGGRPASSGERLRPAVRFTGAAAAVCALLYLPVVAAAGLGASFDLLVRYPVEDFSDYQSLPFPLDYDGPLNTGSVGGFLSDSAESLLLFYLPLVLVVGLIASLAALAFRFDREQRWWQLAAGVFAVGMAHYLFTRPDAFHTAPLAVMVALLAAWALADAQQARAAARGLARPASPEPDASAAAPRLALPAATRRLARPAALAAAAVAGLAVAYAVVEGLDRRWLELRGDHSPLRLPAADGVRVRADRRDVLERAVGMVQARVPPGWPIYVATRRSDLVTSGDPLFYVLADRRNPTRYYIHAPGVITSAPVQREIVSDLESVRPRAVVRFTSPVTAAREPNRAGESSGVAILDDYLRRAYRPAATAGPYVILARRRGRG
jgi:hypothetical protein